MKTVSGGEILCDTLRLTVNGAVPVDITRQLIAWSRGDAAALNEVMPLVYEDLLAVARRQLRQCRGRILPSSGTLANEAYLRLVHARGVRCHNRAHFFALCSQMIRRILVDHARKRGSAKRGGGQTQVPLNEVLLGSRARGVDIEALDEALTELAKVDARKSRVVELRFFGGLTLEEVAEVLEISEETVTRDWRVAKTWLFRELVGNTESG